MENSLNKFIDILENMSKNEVEDMVTVCKRKNNKKRDYLFVNKLQGKHIPQSPKRIIGLFDELLIEIENNIDKTEKILVIGFAETATAIGQHIANKLNNCIYRLQTTREDDISLDKLISFEEEHSHSVGQWVYSKDKLPDYDRVLFVEDEITTGNTILNFINKFKEINTEAKYSVASILNWQNRKDTETYKNNNIDTYYLVRGSIKEDIKTLSIGCEDYLTGKKTGCVIKNSIKYPFKNRDIAGDNTEVTREIYTRVVELSKFIANTILHGNKVLIIGTEEFMYIPILIAKDIEEKGYDVKFHATTRSPICINGSVQGYAIINGFKTESVYGGRETYLYNTGDYDNVLVITDTSASEGFTESMKTVFGDLDIIEITPEGYEIW